MEPRLFQRFCRIARDSAGINLKEGKEALVSARVAKRMRVLGLARAEDYLELLEADETGDELTQFLDVISTNFTSFFREAEHFAKLSERLAEILASGRRRIRIWCAASATGEEPYSLAMTVADFAAGRGIDCRILATDISTRALAAASAGRYSEDRLAAVPDALRAKSFDPVDRDRCGSRVFEAKPALKEMILFRRLNLARPPFPMRGPMDVVFCRNVMIYFDRGVRQGLVSEIERLLGPGGLLMVGHSETLTGIDTRLQLVRPSVYAKPGAAPGLGAEEARTGAIG